MKAGTAVAFEAKKPLEIVEIDLEGPIITPVLTLEEINKGFNLMHAGESIRSVVVF